MSATKTSKLGTLVAIIVSSMFIVASLWAIFNRQFVFDQLTVWSYEPSSSVQLIDEQVGFTDRGRFVFFATKPVVAPQAEFNELCPRQEIGNPILGCYTGADRIFIYELTNEELAGMQEVTAVHEMLHAVWARHSDDERAQLEADLMSTYESMDNDELKSRMDYYQRTEPGQIANELHSILGTESADLSPKLEAYYAQYFDRKTVLSLYEKYRSVYKNLHDQVNEISTKMDSLANSIKSRSEIYANDVANLSETIAAFNEKAASGGFSSMSQFYAERNRLTALSGSLDVERESINDEIRQYNIYYDEYKVIAEQIDVLNQSIDSFADVEKAPSVE